MSFPAYPEYKNSGVEWLSEIPASWKVCRLKEVARHNIEKLAESTDPSTEFSYIEIGDVNYINGVEQVTVYDFEDAPSRARRVVSEGDVLISTVRTYLKAIAQIGETNGLTVASTGFCALRAETVDPRYLYYAVSSNEFVEDVISRSVGVSYPAINADELITLKIAVPSSAEQRAIAAFLNRETAKIDAAVAAQRRLIELLAEKRQATISHAVTKGVNPDAPMKDSGIEWLGEIPAHWEVRQFRNVIRSISSGCSVNANDVPAGEGELAVLKTSCVYSGVFEPQENKAVFAEDTDRVSCHVEADRLIVSRMNTPELVGSAGATTESQANLFLPDRLWQIAFNNIETGFVHRFTQCPVYRIQVRMACDGTSSSMQNLDQNSFKSFLLPIPPAREQLLIVQFLHQADAKTAVVVNAAQLAIALLKERRAALISAAVTGKIDVRGEVEGNNVVALGDVRSAASRERVRGIVGASAITRFGRLGRMAVMKAGYLAEAHAGISELEGRYERAAAGPYCRGLIHGMEGSARQQFGIETQEGERVRYTVPSGLAVPREALREAVGDECADRFFNLLSLLDGFTRESVEAVATLYAAWNDSLARGSSVSDDQIQEEVLSNWHEEKGSKFTRETLAHWLAWMRRNDVVPDGTAPRTDHQARLV